MRLWELESALQNVQPFETPVIELEQYPTSPHLASQVIHTMHSRFDDIEDKSILDLGCGTGMLGIGCSLMGAGYVLGIDIDENALQMGLRNAEEAEGDMEFCRADVLKLRKGKKFDTVIMNPPFGTKRKGVDIGFLKKGFEMCCGTVYSLHKTSTREYIEKKTRGWGAEVEVIAEMRFDVGNIYRMHRENNVDVAVDVWRMDVRNAREINDDEVEVDEVVNWSERQRGRGLRKRGRGRSRGGGRTRRGR